jgi:hypothetical protein
MNEFTARSRAGIIALACALLASLAACRAPSPRAAVLGAAPAPATSPGGIGTYDWHALLVAPFGSALKDIPLALHEVLLFRDEAPGGASNDDAECYAADAAYPSFAERQPADYMLCFQHDRLSRIEVSLRLTAAEAPAVFAAACASWLKAPAPAETAACEGRDGDIRFSSRLGEDAVWFITLDGEPSP